MATARPIPLGRDLIGLKPDVLVAGSMSGALAAQAATQTIPTVIITPDDPVASGFARSIARPSGNITGMWFDYDALVDKRLEFLKLAVPPRRARWGHRQPGRSNRRRLDPATDGGDSCLRYDARAV